MDRCTSTRLSEVGDDEEENSDGRLKRIVQVRRPLSYSKLEAAKEASDHKKCPEMI